MLFEGDRGLSIGLYFGIINESHLNAPVAQLDRASDFESAGRGFESLRARHDIIIRKKQGIRNGLSADRVGRKSEGRRTELSERSCPAEYVSIQEGGIPPGAPRYNHKKETGDSKRWSRIGVRWSLRVRN